MRSELNSFTIPKSTNPVKGKALVAKSDHRPSKQVAPQDDALITRAVKSPTDATIMVTCPTCGAEAVAEKCRPDFHKLSGQSSSRRYLRFKVDGTRRTLDKLLQAEKDLKEKFVQVRPAIDGHKHSNIQTSKHLNICES
jgi:hypothetical protein